MCEGGRGREGEEKRKEREKRNGEKKYAGGVVKPRGQVDQSLGDGGSHDRDFELFQRCWFWKREFKKFLLVDCW